jgi:hypothetical protein
MGEAGAGAGARGRGEGEHAVSECLWATISGLTGEGEVEGGSGEGERGRHLDAHVVREVDEARHGPVVGPHLFEERERDRTSGKTGESGIRELQKPIKPQTRTSTTAPPGGMKSMLLWPPPCAAMSTRAPRKVRTVSSRVSFPWYILTDRDRPYLAGETDPRTTDRHGRTHRYRGKGKGGGREKGKGGGEVW